MTSTTTITTGTAAFVGTERQGVSVFTGIRYATAARFERPVPVAPAGTVDATRRGTQCPQVLGMLEQAMGVGDLPMSEDCLFLNVWTPGADDRRRPVVVWIHGGAFITGTGAMPWYDGVSLARRGEVVVVTINYRLGVFGYLGTSNLGTCDQLAALDWVQHNIASFGGDPDNVTVFGESAGGSGLLALMAIPGASTRFHRGWAMSPSITQLRDAHRAAGASDELLAAAGVASIDELRSLPVETLLAAQQEVFNRPGDGFTAFSPTVDGDLHIGGIADAAAASGIPLVIGTTRDEMQLFNAFNPAVTGLDDQGLQKAFTAVFGESAPTALDAYRHVRPGATNGQLLSAMQTDATFRAPARRAAEAASARGTQVWSYWFTQASKAFGGVLGSCHGIDIPFAFHNLDAPGVAMFLGGSPGATEAADAFSDALLSFARDGVPGWDRYSVDRRATMEFCATSGVIEDPERELRELWENVQ